MARIPIADVGVFGEAIGLADVTLIVEDVRIPVIKAVLSMASPVFRAMFQDEFKEKNQSEITLPGKNLQTFLSFLRCIYPDKKETITEELALSLLPLATEYQVDSLREKCVDCLVETIKCMIQPDMSTAYKQCCYYLVVTEMFTLKRLREICINVMSSCATFTRESYLSSHNISKETQLEIANLACRKHEMNEKEYNAVIEVLAEGKEKAKVCSIRKLQMGGSMISMILHSIRLAYKLDRNLYNELVASFNPRGENLSTKEEYILLPEEIKSDIQHKLKIGTISQRTNGKTESIGTALLLTQNLKRKK